MFREDAPLDRASNKVLERELHEILSGIELGKRLHRYWSLEKITVLDE